MRSKSRRELACPERGGGCEQSEQTEGLNRGFAICPQPLSRLAATAPRPGSLLAFCYHHPKAVPVYGESGTKCRKGNGLEMLTAASYSPLSFAYAQQNAGWNMVVLQRCRLQYSLFRPILPSLHRPLGVLGSNPPQAGTAFGQRLNHKNERVHKKERPHAPFFNFVMLFSPSPRRLQRPLLCASGR